MSFHLRNRRKQEDHGVDDWLMTYADLITLLLCFFAVFLSVSVPKKEIFAKARQEVLEQFADAKDDEVIYLARPTHSQSGGVYDALPAFVGDRYPVEGFNGTYQKKKLGGDRILSIEVPSAAFFASGSAVLRDQGKALLVKLLNEDLKEKLSQGYRVTIEGHTDDVPINTYQFPSNWELSTARATSVVRFFIEKGVPPKSLRASGYADALPKLPNRDAAGKPILENQSLNRRVVIKLEKIEKDE